MPGSRLPPRPLFETREGEVRLDFDPAKIPGDASILYIGSVASPWHRREDCPKNMREARQRGESAFIRIDSPYRRGLDGLRRSSHLIILTWLNHAPRDLIVQKPRSATQPRGTFSLRSPVRPNPIGLHVVRLREIDQDRGILIVDAIDVLDGTPVIDIKPYLASIDSFPDAEPAGQ